jgi:hypothetical protein
MNSGPLPAVIQMLGWLLLGAAALTALGCAITVGRIMVRSVLDDHTPVTSVDRLLPLRGRWLRLLLVSPLVVLTVVVTAFSVFLLLLIVAWIAGAAATTLLAPVLR